MLLTCCFVVGIIIHQCKEDNNREYATCDQTIGLSLDSYKATFYAIVLTASMFIISMVFISVLAGNAASARNDSLGSTKDTPRLDMVQVCKHHMFISHV